MGASRTLRRHLTKERAELPDGQIVYADITRAKGSPKGQPFRRCVTTRNPTEASPYEGTYHATKGRRLVRVAV